MIRDCHINNKIKNPHYFSHHLKVLFFHRTEPNQLLIELIMNKSGFVPTYVSK